jgi:hypothetical protein
MTLFTILQMLLPLDSFYKDLERDKFTKGIEKRYKDKGAKSDIFR